MQVELVDRSHNAVQEPLTADQLLAMCERAFGPAVEVSSIRELAGGTINNTYRITLRDRPEVVLRVAPRDNHPRLLRHERRLLRREFAIQPFLAPIARLVPPIVMADFTQQLIERDFMFQPYIAGELWRDVHDELSPTEQVGLWHQLGRLARAVHNVEHSAFGSADPISRFSRWSDALTADFELMLQDMDERHIPTAEVRAVAEYVRMRRELFDAIQTPRLLHGNLWMSNILVRRSAGGVSLAGVIGAAFAAWGDPAADWPIVRLTIAPMAGSSPFWETYGALDQGHAATCRLLVYQARSIGFSLLNLQRMGYGDTGFLWKKLREIAEFLQASRV